MNIAIWVEKCVLNTQLKLRVVSYEYTQYTHPVGMSPTILTSYFSGKLEVYETTVPATT